MASSDNQRVRQLSGQSAPLKPRCVLYLMSRDQRLHYNHALSSAQARARATNVPLIVAFALYPTSTKRAEEQALFMLTGLEELNRSLYDYGIPFVVRLGSADAVYHQVCKDYQPAAVYFDMSPLTGPRGHQQHLAETVNCPVYVVDAHNIVPVWQASDKQEYAARTIRPKLHRQLASFMDEPIALKRQDYLSKLIGSDKPDFKQLRQQLSYQPAHTQLAQVGGEQAAQAALSNFIESRLKKYNEARNDPSQNGLSALSPYLHFGQLSSQFVVAQVQLAVEKDNSLETAAEAYIEEVFVRRELADNFCYYNQDYMSLKGAPDWAQKTLQKHLQDEREHLYDLAAFRACKTHDPAWNAAQRQLIQTGKMHGYMRMYWAKKVLEWSESPEHALKYLIELNDFYSIDGGDPNGYVGILWSVAGLHDRPWGERPVYGTVRSMSYNGLHRKFPIDDYISQFPNN